MLVPLASRNKRGEIKPTYRVGARYSSLPITARKNSSH